MIRKTIPGPILSPPHRLPWRTAQINGLRLPFSAFAVTWLCMQAAAAQDAGAEEGGERAEELIVTGTFIEVPRRALTTAVSVISGDEIELRGYNSLADAMRTQPSIGVSNTGGIGKPTTLRIRGEEGYRTLLMIDGVKALDPSTPQVAPSFDSLLTTSDLERVEVLRGPQGFIYGADAGGVVNILTRTGDGPFGGRLGLEGGEYGTARLDASVAGGNTSGDYYLAVTDFETDGFNARASDTELQDKDGAENTTLHARFSWNATDRLRVGFVARDIDATAKFDACGFPSVHDCLSTTEQTTYRLSASHNTERFDNRFAYSEVDIERDSLASGVSTFATTGSIARIEYTGTLQLSESATFVFGADLQDEDIVSGATPDERGQDGYYLEYQRQFADRFYLSVGGRYDDNEDFGSATSTRMGAAYVQDFGAGQTLKYRAAYGTGFRPPSMYEIAYNSGPFAFPPAAGTALVEETSEGYELGVEYDTPAGLHLEFTWFDQTIDDAIAFDLSGFSGYLQEPGTSTSEGFEIAALVPLGERVELLANWTENETRNVSGQQRALRPETLANVGVRFVSSTQSLRVLTNYRVSRDTVEEIFAVGFVPLEDYQVLDVAVAWDLSDRISIHGRIENLLDEHYVEITDYNTAARALYGGVRLRF